MEHLLAVQVFSVVPVRIHCSIIKKEKWPLHSGSSSDGKALLYLECKIGIIQNAFDASPLHHFLDIDQLRSVGQVDELTNTRMREEWSSVMDTPKDRTMFGCSSRLISRIS